jgi:hypothetical protein
MQNLVRKTNFRLFYRLKERFFKKGSNKLIYSGYLPGPQLGGFVHRIPEEEKRGT